MTLYDRVSGIPVTIDEVELERREMETSSGFERVTTLITLTGDGHRGQGEDVTYETDRHDALLEAGSPFYPTGRYTIDEFSTRVGEIDLFPSEDPDQHAFRYYRRWAFESAALDLALKQAGTSLADRFDLESSPVKFVVSTRLGDPPTITPVRQWLDVNPDLEFKLDPTSDWTAAVIDELADSDAVRILDLKGQYEGTEIDQDPDPDLYRSIVESFPDAIIEDPAVTTETRPSLEPAAHRVSWDYPITGIEDVRSVPMGGDWINIKPSRFGSVRSLLETIEFCLERGIDLYGGGQFELDVGREHLHAIASLFYPDAPNDIAPSAYNAPEPTAGLPTSPLRPPSSPSGLTWS